MKKITLFSALTVLLATSAFAGVTKEQSKQIEASACENATQEFRMKFHSNPASPLCSVRLLSVSDQSTLTYQVRLCSMNLNDLEPSGVSEGNCVNYKMLFNIIDDVAVYTGRPQQ